MPYSLPRFNFRFVGRRKALVIIQTGTFPGGNSAVEFRCHWFRRPSRPIGNAPETLSGEGQLISVIRIRSPPGGLTCPKARRIGFLPKAPYSDDDGRERRAASFLQGSPGETGTSALTF